MPVDPPLFSSVCLVFVVAIFTFGAAAVICQLKDSFTIFPLPQTAGSVARSTVEVKKSIIIHLLATQIRQMKYQF